MAAACPGMNVELVESSWTMRDVGAPIIQAQCPNERTHERERSIFDRAQDSNKTKFSIQSCCHPDALYAYNVCLEFEKSVPPYSAALVYAWTLG